jgi:transcriptional regulator with XRE-family HTH domain
MKKQARMLQSLGEVVSIHRQGGKLTQTELARKAGVSQVYICRLEMGKIAHPSIAILDTIADELDTTLWKLFFDATLRMQGKNIHDINAIQAVLDKCFDGIISIVCS